MGLEPINLCLNKPFRSLDSSLNVTSTQTRYGKKFMAAGERILMGKLKGWEILVLGNNSKLSS